MHGEDAMAKRTHISVKRAGRGTASQENPAPERRRRRLEPEDREREIIDGAIAFFAEVGFDGGLRVDRLPAGGHTRRCLVAS